MFVDKGSPSEAQPLVMCRCETCGRTYAYDRRKGHTKRACNSCRTNGRIERVDLKREMVAAMGGRCQICGYDRCLRSLCFHHRDTDAKRFNFAGSHCRSRESLWRELEKCVLVCHNCHNEIHEGLVAVPAEKPSAR
jgi:hypothetical protein